MLYRYTINAQDTQHFQTKTIMRKVDSQPTELNISVFYLEFHWIAQRSFRKENRVDTDRPGLWMYNFSRITKVVPQHIKIPHQKSLATVVE